MGRTTSIALLLTGILLFLGSCVPFSYVLYHEVLLEPVDEYTLSASENTETVVFQARPNMLSRFSLEADISTPSVQEDPENWSDEYKPRFRFPVSYSIIDGRGTVILQKKTSLAWKDSASISTRNVDTSSTGGSLTASTRLEKFAVPPDGKVVMEIRIDPDTTYQADYSSAKLRLYEDVLYNTRYLVVGGVMLVLGFIIALLGFIFLIIQSVRSDMEQHAGQEALSTNKDINQDAMIIQLSAFSGYLIPLGSIILPLILWRIWREKDPYLDRMGLEAVNFQLSMLIYYCISMVLMLVLIGFLLIFALMIFHLAFIIIAAIRTSHGADFRYPMTIRFFK